MIALLIGVAWGIAWLYVTIRLWRGFWRDTPGEMRWIFMVGAPLVLVSGCLLIALTTRVAYAL
jgi:hypothetical protein